MYYKIRDFFIAVKQIITMKDINDFMPKIPNMRWGALMNTAPTHEKLKQMNKIFPNNGKWHTVYEQKDFAIIDGKEIRKKDPNKWT